MPTLSRRLVAELFGTFALVFFSASSVVMAGTLGVGYGLLGIALVNAVVFSVAVSATMGISGGFLNPAITTAVLIARRISVGDWIGYLVAELIGAVLAAWCVKLLLPEAAARTALYGTPMIGLNVTFGAAVALEALFTFFLVSAVFGTMISPEAPRIGGFGVGLSLFFLIMVGGPLTGAAMNPARAFGPALISGTWTGHLAYWIGPLIGAVLAGLLWGYFLMPREVLVAEVIVEE